MVVSRSSSKALDIVESDIDTLDALDSVEITMLKHWMCVAGMSCK